MRKIFHSYTRNTVMPVIATSDNYQEGQFTQEYAQALLGLGKSHFSTLLRQHRANPPSKSIPTQWKALQRITPEIDPIIWQELKQERGLIIHKRLMISCYNFTAFVGGIGRAFYNFLCYIDLVASSWPSEDRRIVKSPKICCTIRLLRLREHDDLSPLS